jgi:hypothetical protein
MEVRILRENAKKKYSFCVHGNAIVNSHGNSLQFDECFPFKLGYQLADSKAFPLPIVKFSSCNFAAKEH